MLLQPSREGGTDPTDGRCLHCCCCAAANHPSTDLTHTDASTTGKGAKTHAHRVDTLKIRINGHYYPHLGQQPLFDDELDVAAVGQHTNVLQGVSLHQHKVSSSASSQLTQLTLCVCVRQAVAGAGAV